MFMSKVPSLTAKVTQSVKAVLSPKTSPVKVCDPFGKGDDAGHGKDWGWGKDLHTKGWGHLGGKGHGGKGWAGGKDCDDDEDDDDATGGFPKIPSDTTGVTFHVDLTDDDNADEYFYVQKDPGSTATMSFKDYWNAVKADLAESYPDLDPKDIVIKATIYSSSEGESYYYFTGDEESADDDTDDDKHCDRGHGKHGLGKLFGRDRDDDDGHHGKALACKVVAKAQNLKDLLNQKFCADLARHDKSFDDDAKGDDDLDDDEDDDC